MRAVSILTYRSRPTKRGASAPVSDQTATGRYRGRTIGSGELAADDKLSFWSGFQIQTIPLRRSKPLRHLPVFISKPARYGLFDLLPRPRSCSLLHELEPAAHVHRLADLREHLHLHLSSPVPPPTTPVTPPRRRSQTSSELVRDGPCSVAVQWPGSDRQVADVSLGRTRTWLNGRADFRWCTSKGSWTHCCYLRWCLRRKAHLESGMANSSFSSTGAGLSYLRGRTRIEVPPRHR